MVPISSKKRIFFGSIKKRSKTEDLVNLLYNERWVQKVEVVYPKAYKMTKGFAIIDLQFSKKITIEELRSLNLTFKGEKLHISEYLEGEDIEKRNRELARKKVYVSKIPNKVTKRQLKNLFSRFGGVETAYICKERAHKCFLYGFVTFYDEGDADYCTSLKKVNFGDMELRVKKFTPKGVLGEGNDNCFDDLRNENEEMDSFVLKKEQNFRKKSQFYNEKKREIIKKRDEWSWKNRNQDISQISGAKKGQNYGYGVDSNYLEYQEREFMNNYPEETFRRDEEKNGKCSQKIRIPFIDFSIRDNLIYSHVINISKYKIKHNFSDLRLNRWGKNDSILPYNSLENENFELNHNKIDAFYYENDIRNVNFREYGEEEIEDFINLNPLRRNSEFKKSQEIEFNKYLGEKGQWKL